MAMLSVIGRRVLPAHWPPGMGRRAHALADGACKLQRRVVLAHVDTINALGIGRSHDGRAGNAVKCLGGTHVAGLHRAVDGKFVLVAAG